MTWNFPTCASQSEKANSLEHFILMCLPTSSKNKTTTDETYKGHLLLALERIKEPEKAKPTIHKEIPPGAPIGCEDFAPIP